MSNPLVNHVDNHRMSSKNNLVNEDFNLVHDQEFNEVIYNTILLHIQ